MFPRPSLPRFRAAWLAVVLALLGGPAALAHAVLLERSPAEGDALARAPREVRLRFNEPVTPVTARVLNASGAPVTAPGDLRVVDDTLLLALPPTLAEGAYVVTYRVISADSHPVGGSFVFSVGAAPAGLDAAALLANVRGVDWSLPAIAVRTFRLAFLLAAAGGALFLCAQPRQARWTRADRRHVSIFAALAVAAFALEIGVAGAQAGELPAGALLVPATWRLGAGSSFGLSALVACIALGVTALAVLAQWRGLAAVASPTVLAALALTGHAAIAPPAALAAPALALHAMAAAAWFGALPLLAGRVRALPAAEAAAVVRRFSGMATVGVSLLLACGAVLASLQLGAAVALTQTAYGGRLLAKLAGVALLLAFAAHNRFRLTDALAADRPGAGGRLRRAIHMETAVAVVVLGLAASLSQVTPPRARAEAAHHHGGDEPGFTAAVVQAGRVAVVAISPGSAGVNSLDVALLNADGTPLESPALTVWLSAPSLGIEPAAAVAQRVAPGRYRVARANLPISGAWSIEIDALISDFAKMLVATTVPVR